MTFSLQTLLALLASSAVALACLRSATLGIALMVCVLPISMMLIGITSPSNGHQLDPSKRWYFFVLLKTWIYSLGILTLTALLFMAAPSLQDRVMRALDGDMRSYRIAVSFDGDEETSERLDENKQSLYDSVGLIGEVRDVGCWTTTQNGKQIGSRIWIVVSTDRDDVLQLNGAMLPIDIRPNGSLIIRD